MKVEGVDAGQLPLPPDVRHDYCCYFLGQRLVNDDTSMVNVSFVPAYAAGVDSGARGRPRVIVADAMDIASVAGDSSLSRVAHHADRDALYEVESDDRRWPVPW